MQRIDFVMNMRMNIINNAIIPVMKNNKLEFSIFGHICRDQLIYSLAKDSSKYNYEMNKLINNIFKKNKNSIIEIIIKNNNKQTINDLLVNLKHKLQYLLIDFNSNINLNIKMINNNSISFNINDYKFMINIYKTDDKLDYDDICCNNILWLYKLSLFDIYEKYFNLSEKFNKKTNIQSVITEIIKQQTSILKDNQLKTISIVEILELEYN